MYKLEQAIGKYIVVEPYEESKTLLSNELSSIFKVISVGLDTNIYVNIQHDDNHKVILLKPNDLIDVALHSIQISSNGLKYVIESDIIAKVTE